MLLTKEPREMTGLSLFSVVGVFFIFFLFFYSHTFMFDTFISDNESLVFGHIIFY